MQIWQHDTVSNGNVPVSNSNESKGTVPNEQYNKMITGRQINKTLHAIREKQTLLLA